MLRRVFGAMLIGFVFLYLHVLQAEDISFFAARREALMKRMQGSIAVLEGAPETRSYAAFRQDNNFYYLTGVEVPGALLLLDGVEHRSILFLPPRNKELERWEGPRLSPGPEALAATGMDEVLEDSKLKEELQKRRGGLRELYTTLTPAETAETSRDRALQYEAARKKNPWDGRISRAAAFGDRLQATLGRSVAIRDLSPFLDDMRRVKDSQEIERLREAGRIGALGIQESIRSAKPGMYEYQIAAIADFLFLWHGAMGPAFFPIVGSGPNSCVLHYSENSRKTADGDMVVFDFGADFRYYESDITRSFPISGKFSQEQAKVYQAVLDSQKAATEKVRPGATFTDLNNAARESLDRFGYSRYLTHGVSHYVGMSTHDVGSAVPFEPGVVVTVEPGVYMPEKNLGIRIEDTVLVTRDGYEVLTNLVPKEIPEIEKLMSEKGLSEALTSPQSSIVNRQ
jgi:Xaa-Pro aminopeptidase